METLSYNFSSYSDHELFGFFSDLYKDVLGHRPSGEFWTRERVIEWCTRETSPEAMARHQANWAAEGDFLGNSAALEEALVAASSYEPRFASRFEEMAWNFGF